MIIPTSQRWQLPKRLAYPIGAEEISRLLQDAPQYSQLSIWFTYFGYADDFRAGKPTSVFWADYYSLPDYGASMPRRTNRPDYYCEEWKLHVGPCPREKKALARKLLSEEGIPKIARWLTTPRPETWHSGYHSCTIRIDLEQGKIIVEEK
jgi:hypothetical protein